MHHASIFYQDVCSTAPKRRSRILGMGYVRWLEGVVREGRRGDGVVRFGIYMIGKGGGCIESHMCAVAF